MDNVQETSKQKEIKKQVWYNNGIVNKKVNIDELPPEGFVRGKIIDKAKEAAALEKRKKTMLEKYGSENIMTVPGKIGEEIKQKIRDTNQEKYGSDYGFQSEEVKDKIKKTVQEKYGVENVFQAEAIKEKLTATKVERYGYENTFQDKQIHEKAIKNSTTKAAIKKRQETMLKLYNKKAISGTVYKSNSKPNIEFADLLKQYGIQYEKEFYVSPLYYDFIIDNYLIEIDPYATHNSTWGTYGNPKDKQYHYLKSKLASNNGYKCIHIFDWDDAEKIINCFLITKPKIQARQCEVKKPTKEETEQFINKYHIQGNAKYEIAYGLYFENKLVSVMTFGKPRYNKKYEYELIRYCGSASIIGGAEKIFSHFINDYKPKNVISYCDYSKFDGNVYKKLGFKQINFTIGKHWYNGKTGKHITNNLLLKYGFDGLLGKEYGNFGKGTSNESLMKEHKFVEVYDAGQYTFIWETN